MLIIIIILNITTFYRSMGFWGFGVLGFWGRSTAPADVIVSVQ